MYEYVYEYGSYNGRQVELKQKTMEGKGLLADAVRMHSRASAGATVHVLVHAGLSSGIDSRVCYYNLRPDIQSARGNFAIVRVEHYECA